MKEMPETKTRMLPEEAAQYLGCKYDKLMQMVRLKQIPHYRLGRRVFFVREALDQWIENQVKQSTESEEGLRLAR